jgi:hypothetical protein
MRNRQSLLIILLLLIVALLGYSFNLFRGEEENAAWLIDGALRLAQLLGVYVLITNSNITKTIYWPFIVFFFALTILGALIKILHWAGADETLMVSLLGTSVTYLIRFIRKPHKGHLDVLKLLWVLSAYVGAGLIIFHFLPREYSIVGILMFWLMMADFAFLEFRRDRSSVK